MTTNTMTQFDSAATIVEDIDTMNTMLSDADIENFVSYGHSTDNDGTVDYYYSDDIDDEYEVTGRPIYNNYLVELIKERLIEDSGDEEFCDDLEITTDVEFPVDIEGYSTMVSVDVDNYGTHTIFTMGKCHYLAYKLQELTGLPLAVWTEKGCEDKTWRGHVAIAVNESLYLDLEGLVTNKEIQERYEGLGEPVIYNTFKEAFTLPFPMKMNYERLGELEREFIAYIANDLVNELSIGE